MSRPQGRFLRPASLVILAGVFAALAALPSGTRAAAPAVRETHRIRVVNKAGGVVSVSLDRGKQFTEVARVLRPATSTSPGFPATAGAAPGAVAALSLDRWLIRTDAAGAAPPSPRVIGLCARGAGAGDATTEVDLPPAAALFTSLAPLPGSRVFLQNGSVLSPMRPGYSPQAGDVWVIVAELPAQLPAELIFENTQDGAVTAVGRDGAPTRVGRVVKPARGVGRYPGTEIATPGRLAAHHPGGFVIATPASGDAEPAASGLLVHSIAFTDAAAREAPSVLLVEPVVSRSPSLFSLAIPFRGAGSDTRMEMRWPGKDWEELPQRNGGDATAFVNADGTTVERFRLRVGGVAATELAAALKRSARAAPTTAAPPSRKPAGKPKAPVYKGRLTVAANVTGRGIQMVKFLLDGQVRAIDNNPPYAWEWDTRASENGEHTIEIQGLDLSGKIINTTKSRVIVAN